MARDVPTKKKEIMKKRKKQVNNIKKSVNRIELMYTMKSTDSLSEGFLEKSFDILFESVSN